MHDAPGNKTGEPANVPAVGRAPDISHKLSYGYDTRDELTGEQSAQAGSGSGGTSVYGDAFAYDLSYNPTAFKGATVTENADNQFSLSGYLFDGNGNPTTYSGKNLAFDIENRLVAITSPAFSAAYAPDDRRASKTASGATTYYLYDEDGGASPLLEEQGTGTVSMGYGMAGDGLRARYAPASGGLYYLFQWDPQGSLVQRQTGGTGGAANTSYYALDTAMFDGYGAKLGDTDAFTGGSEATRDAMGFQGQFGAYTDNETGLVLMGHRYYDAGTGRFLTRDPLGYGGGINLYGFTGNNPVNEMDPEGTQDGSDDPNNPNGRNLLMPPLGDTPPADPVYNGTAAEHQEHPSVAAVLSGRAGRVTGERMTIRRFVPGSGDQVLELFRAEIKSLARQQDKRARYEAFNAQIEALSAPLTPAQMIINRAAKLGYAKTSIRDPHGEAVFFNRKNRTYISADNTSHNADNAWKVSQMVNGVRRRQGTYNASLTRRLKD